MDFEFHRIRNLYVLATYDTALENKLLIEITCTRESCGYNIEAAVPHRAIEKYKMREPIAACLSAREWKTMRKTFAHLPPETQLARLEEIIAQAHTSHELAQARSD